MGGKAACLSVVLGIVLSIGFAFAEEVRKEDAAVASAEKWLAKVDSGKYAESWKDAAEYFRKAVTQDQWEQSMRSGRTPLGKLVSREVKSTDYRTSLPGLPDGEYLVIQFETSFENKKLAIETVTAMMEKDKTWRVSGYFIQ
jgi:hypothetical protein